MSNRFKKAVIEGVTSHGIDITQQAHLLDLFESAMKSIATTLAREAKFDTTDFATAKQRNCQGFQLLVQRVCIEGQSQWHGEFSKADQRLNVIGSLE
jgi:hypothetical protein